MPLRSRPVSWLPARTAVGVGVAAAVAVAAFGCVSPATAAPVSTPTAAADVAAAPAAAPAADGVAVGSGSYAATPPASIASIADVQKTVDQHLYIDPSRAGEPVPTNQWWTDLVVSRFSGDLWANPFVSSNSAGGTKVSYPTEWNADGTAMQLSDPITVSGSVTPSPDASSVVLGDFEHGTPTGWTTTGDAFTATASGTATGQSAVSGWLGNGFANSFTNASGDGATGTLTSPAFTVDRSTIAALVGGGDHPGQEAVELVVDGTAVRSTTGSNSEQLRWTTWDVAEYRGRTAQIRVVDTLTSGWAHVLVDQVVATDDATDIATQYSTAFTADRADALRWGDWNVSWRMPQVGTGGQYMDVTSVQGEPFEWFEYHGMTPRLTLAPGAVITDGHGETLGFPLTADRFQVEQNGHVFGVHAPEGTTFTKSGNVLEASAGTAYLVLSAVPASGLTLDELHRYAFAIPRDTTMDHHQDAAAGEVVLDWSVDTEPLQGTNRDTVQGWLKHQYKSASTNLDFTGAEYETPRGTMKTTIGHGGWQLRYDFSGLTPIGGTQGAGAQLDADQKRIMQRYVTEYAAKTTYGGDTYWGGKDLQQLAQYMLVAKQIGDHESEAALKATLEKALTDWYTYTSGEREHFFAMYPTWKALIGFGDSYGSAQFNDNHFHYGYFAVATAILGQEDPAWIKRYEGMATLVNKQYANGDRTDQRFPYLRTFSVWEGHSNAGGFSSPGGNNQESSSEAIQSEAGSYLLGTILGDERMQATGAMEYVTERAAVREYYQNASGNPASASHDGDGAFPEAYHHGQAGILFDSGQAYATYFSGDPAWIYGIQWMPTAPWFNYFGWDPGLSASIMQQMMAARPRVVGQEGTTGGNAGHIQMLTKRWYGVGSYGDVAITQDRSAAIGELEDAVRAAEENHPGYVTAKTAANPLYDAATDTLYVSTDSKGEVVFPAQYWTPETLPASLVPARLSGADADEQPRDWPVRSPLLSYLSTDYTADEATINALYGIDLTHYTPGEDTAQAVHVFSAMGDALGNVVLGFLAQYDPATYADVHAALWKVQDPAVTGQSMAGLVYHQAMSNLAVGTEVRTRHTDAPLSQVYRNADGRYSYVIDNPGDAQQTYHVYEGSTVIGTIAVPAHTQITSHLDAELSRIVVSADGDPKTVVPGTTTAFTATGYDQYGATVPLDGLTWKTTAGTIDAEGRYTAGNPAATVTVTATLGDVSAAVDFRVGAAPVLSTIAVTPGFTRAVVGTPVTYAATGRDQYGDATDLGGAVTWSYTGQGTITPAGVLTTTAPGAGHVVATVAGVEGSVVASSVSTLVDAARGASATATSSDGRNTPDKALDGDASTRWESGHGTDAVDYTVDLGRATDIASVALTWEGAAAKQYELQVADSIAGPWTTVKTVAKTNAGPDTIGVDATARYVRMHGISRLTAYGYSIWSFQVNGTPAASAITPSAVLVGPRASATVAGGTTRLRAYAFDTAGNGGPVDAGWGVDGVGSVTQTGVYTAPDTSGTATVTATVGGLVGRSTITTVADAPAPVAAPAHASQDIAVGKRVTTSSDENDGLVGQYAVDGSRSTRWASAHRDGQWIAVDLGAVVPIDGVELDWEAASADTYRIQVRDTVSEDWRTVVDEAHGAGGVERHDLTGVDARYVRMLGGTRHTSYGYSLHELRVFSTQGVPTPDLALRADVTSSSDESDTFPAARAVDGNAGTRWASGHTDDQWLQVDLGSPQVLHSATLSWEAAYGEDYRLEARNSPSEPWATLATEVGGTGGTDTTALDGTYRYVRFHGVHRATQWGYSLYAFEVR